LLEFYDRNAWLYYARSSTLRWKIFDAWFGQTCRCRVDETQSNASSSEKQLRALSSYIGGEACRADMT